MLNIVWLTLILLSIVLSFFTGTTQAVVAAAIHSAESAVTIAIGLIGIMALWLGLMKIAESSGLIKKFSKLFSPVFRFLFPDVPANHPALDAMSLNMSANLLGLGNAATPFGLRAMKELETLNPTPGTATDAMCMFLAINTSSLQLIPATVIGILAAGGATHPTTVIVPTILATACGLTAAVTTAKWCARGRKI
jgi:spore maturation protein A